MFSSLSSGTVLVVIIFQFWNSDQKKKIIFYFKCNNTVDFYICQVKIVIIIQQYITFCSVSASKLTWSTCFLSLKWMLRELLLRSDTLGTLENGRHIDILSLFLSHLCQTESQTEGRGWNQASLWVCGGSSSALSPAPFPDTWQSSGLAPLSSMSRPPAPIGPPPPGSEWVTANHRATWTLTTNYMIIFIDKTSIWKNTQKSSSYWEVFVLSGGFWSISGRVEVEKFPQNQNAHIFR